MAVHVEEALRALRQEGCWLTAGAPDHLLAALRGNLVLEAQMTGAQRAGGGVGGAGDGEGDDVRQAVQAARLAVARVQECVARGHGKENVCRQREWLLGQIEAMTHKLLETQSEIRKTNRS